MIKTLAELRGENIDWEALGDRVKRYRVSKDLSKIEAAKQIDVTESSLDALENGYRHTPNPIRKSTNVILRISQVWNLSLNWLVNGIGSQHDADPIGLLAETLVIQKGAGIRRSTMRVKAEEGEFSDEVMEFVFAIDKYKRVNDIRFPSYTQIFEIILALGYRKAVPARIAPLVYVIEQQKLSEKLKQISEPEETDERFDRFPIVKKPVISEARKRFNIKKREEEAIRNFINDPTLNKTEKERRLKISRANQGRTSVPEKFLFIDPNGQQFVTANLTGFCRENNLNPNHMYTIATGSGKRKTHKKWKAKELPTFTDQVLQKIQNHG
ncbi:MAG: helix-turn-helix domain-containing protein [Candidatus Hodarchaeales archaeon]|jgi:transcriptional regulator with XRE-family HTH domain